MYFLSIFESFHVTLPSKEWLRRIIRNDMLGLTNGFIRTVTSCSSSAKTSKQLRGNNFSIVVKHSKIDVFLSVFDSFHVISPQKTIRNQ